MWLREYWREIALAAGLCALLAGLLYLAVHDRPSSAAMGVSEDAEILRFGYYETKWRHRPVVIARTRDGAVRQLYATPQRLRHCRKGSRIILVRKGPALFVDPRSCPAPGLLVPATCQLRASYVPGTEPPWHRASLAPSLLAGLLVWLWSTTGGPDRFEEATVVRFGYYETEWRHRPVVIVRTTDGEVRQLIAYREKLRHCRSGDSISLVRRGAGLFVHSRGCRGSHLSERPVIYGRG